MNGALNSSISICKTSSGILLVKYFLVSECQIILVLKVLVSALVSDTFSFSQYGYRQSTTNLLMMYSHFSASLMPENYLKC